MVHTSEDAWLTLTMDVPVCMGRGQRGSLSWDNHTASGLCLNIVAPVGKGTPVLVSMRNDASLRGIHDLHVYARCFLTVGNMTVPG